MTESQMSNVTLTDDDSLAARSLIDYLKVIYQVSSDHAVLVLVLSNVWVCLSAKVMIKTLTWWVVAINLVCCLVPHLSTR